jgi:hypothetical protein
LSKESARAHNNQIEAEWGLGLISTCHNWTFNELGNTYADTLDEVENTEGNDFGFELEAEHGSDNAVQAGVLETPYETHEPDPQVIFVPFINKENHSESCSREHHLDDNGNFCSDFILDDSDNLAANDFADSER